MFPEGDCAELVDAGRREPQRRRGEDAPGSGFVEAIADADAKSTPAAVTSSSPNVPLVTPGVPTMWTRPMASQLMASTPTAAPAVAPSRAM